MIDNQPREQETERLLQQLRATYQELRMAVRERWDRDLPLDELLFDRWERARTLGFGEGTSIYQSCHVFGDVMVGRNSWIGPFTILEGVGGLRIGSNCSISSGVQIYTHDSVRWALSGGTAAYERAPVAVGDCTYIGSQSVIAKGVTIGDHVVVGACSFVNCDIPPYSIAAGIPARVIGKVEINGEDISLGIRREGSL